MLSVISVITLFSVMFSVCKGQFDCQRIVIFEKINKRIVSFEKIN